MGQKKIQYFNIFVATVTLFNHSDKKNFSNQFKMSAGFNQEIMFNECKKQIPCNLYIKIYKN